MEDVLENVVLQAGILDNEVNPATDSDRVKALVVGAGSTDFGGSQKHDVANQAGAEEVDRLAPTASQKTSEEVEAPNVDHAKKWNKEFKSLEKQINTLIAFMTPKGNIHKEIKKMADGIQITYSCLIRLDGQRLKITNTSKKTAEQQTSPSLAKGTSVLKVTEKVGKVSDTPSKRKDISPLQPEGRKKRKIISRKEKPEQNAPCALNLETDPPEADQEVKDPAWQQVETRKTKKKKRKRRMKMKITDRGYELDERILAH